MLKIPVLDQIGLKQTQQAFFDPAVIAVLSSALIAPYIVPRITGISEQLPVLKSHASIASGLAGVIVFGLAGSIKMPQLLRSVVIGIAGAFILTALIPLYNSVSGVKP